MRRLAIGQGAPPLCLKKHIDGFGDSPYINIARTFRDEDSTPGAPSYGGLMGPAVSKGAQIALDQGLSSLKGPGQGIGS